jgi:nicotinamidase-related amidase
MTFSFRKSRIQNAERLPVFVIVDPCRDILGPANIGMHREAGVLVHCRTALAHARRTGMSIAFIRSALRQTGAPSIRSVWIKGFEPNRNEAILERNGLSCYSGPFLEAIAEEGGGDLVVAGLLGCWGCLATASDALAAGHTVTFLQDAILDEASEFVFPEDSLQLLKAFTTFNIEASTTRSWIEASLARLNGGLGERRRAT